MHRSESCSDIIIIITVHILDKLKKYIISQQTGWFVPNDRYSQAKWDEYHQLPG